MIGLLQRLVEKDQPEVPSPKTTQRTAMLCSATSLLLNLLLFGGKLLAVGVSGSVAIEADAFNNLADAGTCGAELLGFVVAGFGAGEVHPFGHGRIEWLMGLVAAILVLFMGVEMARSSVASLRAPSPVVFSRGPLLVLLVSMAVKFAMYRYNKKIGTQISSVALKAKAYDCLGDLAATAAVLLASLAGRLLGWQIDGWCGVAVSLFILYAGLQALRETAGPLMGSAPDDELEAAIRSLCGEYAQIDGVYELMVHDYGFGRRMVSLHIGGVQPLDRVAAELSHRLRRETGCEATVQVEVLATDERMSETLRDCVEQAVRRVEAEAVVKNFRLLAHTQRVVVTLDVIVPPERFKRENDIQEAVARAVRSRHKLFLVDAKVKMSATSCRHLGKKSD